MGRRKDTKEIQELGEEIVTDVCKIMTTVSSQFKKKKKLIQERR